MEKRGELVLQIYGATVERLPGNALEVALRTSRGSIDGLLHPAEGKTGAVVWVGSASGDMNGPAGGLYADISRDIVSLGISSLRLRYRRPGEFDECVLDALAGISFLKGVGARRIAIVGHSLGGAVAISAGALSAEVTAVAALSSQNAGTHLVSELAPRPLLLVHGMDDFRIASAASEDIYRRAGDPKQLVLYPGTGHGLMESRGDLQDLLWEWLPDKVGGAKPDRTPRRAVTGNAVRPILVEQAQGVVVKEAILHQGDIADVEADAIVCPATDQLWLGQGVGGSIAAKGGEEILIEAQYHAPAEVGSAIVVDGGHLKAKHVIAAVTGSSWLHRPPDEESVREATRSCLRRVEELRLRSIAFPALGTGAGGFAFEKAAHIMVKDVVDHLRKSDCLEKVIFALLSSGACRAFEAELAQYD